MRRYRIWQTGAGPVSVDVRALGLAVLRAELAIIAPGYVVPVPRRDMGDVARFELDVTHVAALRAAPDAGAAPHLAFLCDAFLGTGCPARRWGWAMRFSRDGAALPALRDSGQPLPLDNEGFARMAVRLFPAKVGVARDHAIINLA